MIQEAEADVVATPGAGVTLGSKGGEVFSEIY